MGFSLGYLEFYSRFPAYNIFRENSQNSQKILPLVFTEDNTYHFSCAPFKSDIAQPLLATVSTLTTIETQNEWLNNN